MLALSSYLVIVVCLLLHLFTYLCMCVCVCVCVHVPQNESGGQKTAFGADCLSTMPVPAIDHGMFGLVAVTE